MKIFRIAKKKKTLQEAIKDYTGEKIKGGISDKKSPKDFNLDSLKDGIKVELEHTTDIDIALEIVMDHLTEDKKYYTKLKKMEGHE